MTVTFIVTSVVTCIVTSRHIQVTIFIPLFMRHGEDLVRYRRINAMKAYHEQKTTNFQQFSNLLIINTL